jgi:hypothetical protein
VKSSESRFVILEHTCAGGVHWDLMLEDAGVLLTWSLEAPPEPVTGRPVKSHKIHDHPLRFLEYEGPVQNNTAAVKRIDTGPCKWITNETNLLTFLLEGQVLRGQFHLNHGSGTEWVFCKSCS